MSTKTTITTPDNGYFVVVTLSNGERYRIDTESFQWNLRHGDKAIYRKHLANRIAALEARHLITTN